MQYKGITSLSRLARNELQIVRLIPDPAHPAGISGDIELILGRVELVPGLVSLNLALGINDKATICRPAGVPEVVSLSIPRIVATAYARAHSTMKHTFLLRLIKGQYFKSCPRRRGR